MPKSVVLSAFLVSLLFIAPVSAKLPDTEAVQQAYNDAGAALEEAPEVTAKAYFAIVLAAQPTAANRTKLVESVAATLRDDFAEIGISHDVADACFFHFWQAVAAQFPEEESFQTIALAVAAKQLPWAQAQTKLLARGDAYALGLGLDRLAKSPEPHSATTPFVAAAAAYMAQATPEDLNKFLWLGDKEGYSEIVAAVQKRFLADQDPEIQQLAATPAVRRMLLGNAVREIAAQYDLKTLAPPVLEPWTVQGPGQSQEAFEKLKQFVEGNPKVKAEHAQFRERINAFDALIAAYPNYERIYEYKAAYLFYAGLKEEALLTQTAVVRMNPNSANSGYYSAQARYWMALGFRGQALAEAHRALSKSVSSYDGNTLLIFCEVAVAESLKDDGLVPAGWDAVIAERLGKMEDQQATLMGDSKTLYVDAIRFWDKRGDFPRARAALARLKQKGGSALIAANKGSFAAWEKRWDEGALAFFYGLPAAPKPYGMELELAFHEGDLPGAWTLYSKWAATEPKAVAPRLYGAAAFLDLGAPYLALALIEEGGTFKPTAQEVQLLARIKAGCSARLGESVAAALAYAQSGDVESLSPYWLQVFVEANQAAVYSRISNRALEILSADARDAGLLPWAWQTYSLTAPASAVDTWRASLTAGGGLPKAPVALAAGLTPGVVGAQRRLQVAWSDAQVVQGKVSSGNWFWFAQLAATDGREADAAFYAACWLMGLAPDKNYDAAQEAQARSWVNAYRIGNAAEGDFAEALRRDPCNAEVMVRAYEAARASADLIKAADYLRQILLAYGEDRIDLLTACNVATAAADWELLLTVSQTALAKQPSDESRGWYTLALVACNKIDTARTIRSQMYEGTLRAVAREIDGWVPFVEGYGYTLGVLSDGEYAELHAAIREAQALRDARKNAEQEAEANRYYKNKVIELAAAVSKRSQGASPSTRAHVAFQLGEIDAAAYLAKLTTPDDRTFARIFSILSRWEDGDQAKLDGDDLADVQGIMYDQAQHLRFRVMAYAMLRTAGIAPAPRPLRASDPLLLERAPVGALAEMRAGRLTLVNGAEELLMFLGGASRVSFPNNKMVRTVELPAPPAVMRLRITPDLPEQRLSGLTATNYEQRMMEFGKAGLYPVLERALTTLQLDLAAAGPDAAARWAALKQGGTRVWRLGESFYLEDGTHAEASMAVILAHLRKYPVDAYAVFASRLLPFASIETFIPRLPPDAQAVITIGRQASRNAYDENEKKTGVRSAGFDPSRDVENVLLSFPPGSEMFSFVSEALARKVPPAQIKATVADEKNRRVAAVAAAERRAENLKLFDAALAKGDMIGLEKSALALGGAHYVKWALRSTTASVAQLVQARAYATNWPDTYALTAEIQRRQNDLLKAQMPPQSYRPSRYSGSSGTSWSSFSASMSAKSSASALYQKERDAKNFVIRTRSDGSYSTHRKY